MARRSDLDADIREAVESDPEMVDDAPVRSLNTARRKRQAARRIQALQYRLAGLTYEQIGDHLGISGTGARDMVNRTLEVSAHRNIDLLRELENARLDRIQTAVWAQAVQGDFGAIDRVLRISQRRSRLNGLDMPTDINLNVSIRAQMESALVELRQVVFGTDESRNHLGPPDNLDAFVPPPVLDDSQINSDDDDADEG